MTHHIRTSGYFGAPVSQSASMNRICWGPPVRSDIILPTMKEDDGKSLASDVFVPVHIGLLDLSVADVAKGTV